MAVVSSKEFVSHQDKYFELAQEEQVYVRKGENMYIVSIANDKKKKHKKPDNDFRRAITMDEFIDRALVMVEKVDKMYAKK